MKIIQVLMVLYPEAIKKGNLPKAYRIIEGNLVQLQPGDYLKTGDMFSCTKAKDVNEFYTNAKQFMSYVCRAADNDVSHEIVKVA